MLRHGLAQYGRFGHGAGVEPFQAADAWVMAKPGVELVVADLDADHMGRAEVQRAIGEPAGRLAHIQNDPAVETHTACLQQGLELEPGPRGVALLGVVGDRQRTVFGQFFRGFCQRWLACQADPAMADQALGT